MSAPQPAQRGRHEDLGEPGGHAEPPDRCYVLIDLDFEQAAQPEAFLAKLKAVWSRADLSPGLAREGAAAATPPRARIVEEVAEART